MSGTQFTGRGAGGPSLDQMLAEKLGGESRFRSLQIGVSQESFGESIQRNMSWAGRDRALPRRDDPAPLFDRLFGKHGGRLDKPQAQHPGHRAAGCRQPAQSTGPRGPDCAWMSTWLPSATWSAPSPRCRPTYHKVDPPDFDGDMKDWPRVSPNCRAICWLRVDHAADARGFVHADQVPGPVAIPVAGLHRRAPSRLHASATARRRARTASPDSASCAISAAGTSQNSRISSES